MDAAAYWRKLEQRLKAEGNETVTNCHGLNMFVEASATELSLAERLKISGGARQRRNG